MIDATRIRLILAAAAALLMLTGCEPTTGPPPTGTDTITVVFRDGAEPTSGYLGTRDAVIRDGSAWEMRSSNNGTAAIDTLGVVDIGGSLFARRLLLRFDLTSITDCGTVARAELTLHFEPEDTNQTIWLDVREATVPDIFPGSWVEGSAGSGVSWLYVDESVTVWDAAGGDFLGLLDSKEVRTDTTVTFELDADRVENWIKIPWENDGVLVISRTGGMEAFLHVYMRETAAVGLRPELTVWYIKASGG
jgi:hypothetical protein